MSSQASFVYLVISGMLQDLLALSPETQLTVIQIISSRFLELYCF
uniref:Uncharacterized protein n=2 Tax=unclassified Caudoviricetes TaxID=2788787 RepID=A0A8S5PZT6_9CAUD|nr:MAG TPA: hypothetical protein [Siphoviridae sp. ct89Z21]DAE12582.1 MAG TPA: hypothetical protein [Siphoviridae sp. ctGfm48]